MLITVALLRSAERCTTISTSALAPPPPSAQSPPIEQSSAVSRVSEPMTRMFSGVLPKASGFSASVDFLVPLYRLSAVMLPLRCWYS